MISYMLFQYGTGTKSSMSNRFFYTKSQVSVLKKFFEEKPYPTSTEKAYLSNTTGISFPQINDWFKSKRYRTKLEKSRRSMLKIGFIYFCILMFINVL